MSKDGQWRSFPKMPHLLQYVSNGNYYARIKINGKIIRESLKTSIWLVALFGFGLLFPVLMRLPEAWPAAWRWGIRAAWWSDTAVQCARPGAHKKPRCRIAPAAG